MIERHLTLCAHGRAAFSGYASGLQFGYTHNTGVYRLGVTLADEWSGTTVRAFWHLPGASEPLTTLVADGGIDVPALVTAAAGTGTITFEGSDGTRTVTSASVPYTVLANAGTTDPELPEPVTPAWQQFLSGIQAELHDFVGLSSKERKLILDLFQHAAYGSAEMQDSYNALAALWNSGDAPDQPETPDPPAVDDYGTLLYKLPKTIQLDGTSYLDTKVKLFADQAASDWTVVAAYIGPASCAQGLPNNLFCCCYDGGQGLLCRQVTQGGVWIVSGGRGGFGMENCFDFSGKSYDEIIRPDGNVNVVVVTKEGNNFSFYLNGMLAYNSALEYGFDSTIPEKLSLLFGARYSGNGSTIEYKTAFTLNDARIYDKALEKSAVTALSAELMGG